MTTVLRREDGAWKVVDRHAEPITAPRPPESVIGEVAGRWFWTGESISSFLEESHRVRRRPSLVGTMDPVPFACVAECCLNRSQSMEPLWSPVVATAGNRSLKLSA